MNTDKSHALAQRILFRLARREPMETVELTGLLRQHAADAVAAETSTLTTAVKDLQQRLNESLRNSTALLVEMERLKGSLLSTMNREGAADSRALRAEAEVERQKAARRDEESWWKERHDYKARAERAEAQLAKWRECAGNLATATSGMALSYAKDADAMLAARSQQKETP